MRASGVAARRFYNAFYQWAVLAHAPPAHRRALQASTPALARNLSRSALGKRDGMPHDDSSGRFVRRYATARTIPGRKDDGQRTYNISFPDGSYRSSKPQSRSGHSHKRVSSTQGHKDGKGYSQPTGREGEDRPALKARSNAPESSLIHAVIRTPQERPFAKMHPWEEAVRYKSFAGFSVEICVPEDAVVYIERVRSLQALMNLQDLHVDVGNAVTNIDTAGEAVPVRSVLATGTIDNIEALRRKLQQAKAQLARDSNGVAGTRQHRDEHTSHEHRERAMSPDLPVSSHEPISEENRQYRIRLLLPKVLNKEDSTRFALERSILDDIRTISRKHRCTTQRFGYAMRINGRKTKVQATRDAIQALIDEKCDNQNIPRRELQVLQPLEPSDNQEIGKTEGRIESVKTALRALTSPVVLVVATLRPDGGSSEAEELRGVTVSSLTSVSVDRRPILSFNLRLPSRTWDAIQSHKTVSLSFLTATTEGAAVANVFTKPHANPSDAFSELQRLGYQATGRIGEGARRLVDRHGQIADPVYCTMAANVLQESCVMVDDHVIVVAEVTHVLLAEQSMQRAEAGKAFGLAYGNRAYRHVTDVVEPMQFPKEKSPKNKAWAVRQAAAEAEIDVESTRNGPSDVQPEEFAELYETLERDKAKSEPHSNVDENDDLDGKSQSTDLPPEVAAATDKGAANRPVGQFSNLLDDQQTVHSLEQMETDQAVEKEIAESQDQLWPSVGPVGSPATVPQAKNTASHAAHAEPRSSLGFLKQIWRSYSTSARLLTSSTTSEANASEAVHSESQLSDPTLLSTTAGDFLSRPDDGDPYRLRRMRALMKARRESENASRQLKYLSDIDRLTAKESKRLNNIITRNERWVAKKLALHSAYDLRLMLDKGKVDVTRARWLESSIEKGQAVLAEETEQLEDLFARSKVDEATYKKTKENFEQDALSLATEAMRLRQMAEEEDGVSGNLQQQEKGFDGFSGNV